MVKWTSDDSLKQYLREINGTFDIAKATNLYQAKVVKMPISNKAQETKVTGYISNQSYITLDNDINGTKSFQIPYGKPGRDVAGMSKGDKVIVTLVGNKIVAIEADNIEKVIEKTIDGIKVKKQTKPVTPKIELSTKGFYVEQKHQRVLDALTNAVIKNRKNVAVGLNGAAGYGKTSLAEHFANINNLPLLEIDCSTIDDTQAWFGTPALRDGNTSFELTQLSHFLTKGNCVVTFDELNRAPVWVTNALLPILDHRQKTSMRNVDIQVGNGIAFFVTQNIGWDYAGTNPVDKALRRRFRGIITVDALPPNVESVVMMYHHAISSDICTKIVTVMNKLRKSLVDYQVNVSTATSINIALWIDNGLTPRESFELAIINDAPEDAKKIVLDAISLEGF